MKYIVAILLLTAALSAQVRIPGPGGKVTGGGGGGDCTPASGFSHCISLTINPAQITGTLTNFPIWKAITLGSSRLTSSSCFDYIITSDSTGATKIPWDRVSCTQGTGAIGFWFLGASTTSSSKFYIHYGNASITTAQNTSSYAAANVWVTQKSVWHLGDGTTLSGADSSGNSSTLSTVTGTVTAAAGLIDGAAFINAGTYDGALAGFGTAQTAITASFWLNIDSSYSDSAFGFPIYNTGSLLYFYIDGSRHAVFGVSVGSGTANQTSNTVLTKGVWYYVTGYYDGTNTDIYINGAVDDAGSPSQGTGTISTFSTIELGRSGQNFIGLVDEVQITNSALSANWLVASYNAQVAGSTFLTVGTEV